MRRPAAPPRLVHGPGAAGPARDLRVVLSTAPSRAALRLARVLVTGGHAACVNRVPGVRSVYVWQGRVEEADEVLLVVKTSAQALEGCLAALAGAHPYEVPEGLVLAPSSALAAYADWVRASLRGSVPGRRSRRSARPPRRRSPA